MRGELLLSVPALLGFLLTLARVAGVFVFVPLPGLRTGFDLARVVLSFCVTLCLFPYWPQVSGSTTAGMLAVWILSEVALGIGIGLAVAFVLEAIGVAAQIMGLQAGYAYASTVDPTTQADSSVLVVFTQIAAGLIFLATGLDRDVLRVFAGSLVAMPAGVHMISKGAAERLLSAGAIMFSTGIRLALPVVGVLIMVDISLALLGRINSQLQLLTIAFPIKMLLALAIIGWVLLMVPAILRNDLGAAFGATKGLFQQ